MAMLPRSSLASIVCPSTPFLLPRLLRAPANRIILRLRGATFPVHAVTYATKAVKKGPRRPQTHALVRKLRDHRNPPASEFLDDFRKALDARNWQAIMKLYPRVVGRNILEPNDTRRIASTIHNHLRNSSNRFGESRKVLPFVEQLVQHIRSGELPPHPYAHVHILGIYKECKMYDEGYTFWKWLSDQDNTYVDQAVYGAAIELLACQGRVSLPSLEDLYIQGLKRFPGTFAQYHLSPEAIIPDRTQPTTILGLPILLLQGILTARMMWRDWKNSYLALDTALRLYPTQVPPRFFELFISERPISEGYTTFLLACRSGAVFKPSHFTNLLVRLNNAMEACSSLEDRMAILRGIVNAMYVYLGAGGTIEGPHMSCLLNAFGRLLPQREEGATYEGDDGKIRNMIVTTARGIMSTLIHSGMPPQPQVFVSLIALAGRYNVPTLLTVTLQDIEATHLKLNDIGRRNVLISAGHLKDKDTIERYWKDIVVEADSERKQIAYQDWMSFARACKRADHRNFFREQLEMLKHSINARTQELALHALIQEEKKLDPKPFTSMEPSAFESEIEALQKQLNDFAALVRSGLPLDFHKTPVSMFLDLNKRSLASISDLRTVYDELTTDPHQPPPTDDSKPSVALSPTGIPLDELRFENWVTIVELMSDAEAAEGEFQARLDEAIKSGRPLGIEPDVLSFRKTSQTSIDQSRNSILQVRAMVKRLRTPNIVGFPEPHYNTRSKPATSHSYRPIEIGVQTQLDAYAAEGIPSPISTEEQQQSTSVEFDGKALIRRHVTKDVESSHPNLDSISHRPLGKPKREA
ncbi:hypothetical protein K469DRAFT_682004 [Zopfia rhizophila CBS 207.26]|uniref:Uncharacterized protein n=1 Tax=Zopfia rhizophila CBS 207.26 TaxID=1314779 RepID=A0A6A6EXJ1_9PEZI|nr:hypothetical protein K469DRAFT_682004 [Zopfia rhizophila CBS 207.26]